MAIIQNHAWSGDDSKRLCDLVFESLPKGSTPKRECSSYCKGKILEQKSAMFWIKHTKHAVAFYLACEDTREITDRVRELIPSGIELRVRPFPRKAIALSTPLFFRIETEAQARGIGKLLRYLVALRSNSAHSDALSKNGYWLPPSESESGTANVAEEGRGTAILVNRYERKVENREACIRANGTKCVVCGFYFPSFYGSIGFGANGKGYIHIHHLTTLGSLKGKALRFDPAKDMLPVCPNCHEMLHRSDPPYTPDQLRAIIAEVKEKASSLRSTEP
jgi:hypothetical protein